jgi:membrane protein YdbS with pleckstrin-like domain
MSVPITGADFSLRPVFIGWIAFLVQLPFQLFFTVWSGGFFGGMLGSLAGMHGRAPFVFFGALGFIAVPIVAYFGKKLNCARTEYNLFSDRLEFEEGFFSINRKVIKFRDVEEITLRKGPLQRIYGLGTVYIATLATGISSSYNPFGAIGFGNVSASGVSVRDIPNPDDAYDRVKKLFDACNR